MIFTSSRNVNIAGSTVVQLSHCCSNSQTIICAIANQHYHCWTAQVPGLHNNLDHLFKNCLMRRVWASTCMPATKELNYSFKDRCTAHTSAWRQVPVRQRKGLCSRSHGNQGLAQQTVCAWACVEQPCGVWSSLTRLVQDSVCTCCLSCPPAAPEHTMSLPSYTADGPNHCVKARSNVAEAMLPVLSMVQDHAACLHACQWSIK